MSINVLYIIVPTILILIVLIFFVHSRTKDMKDEIATIRTQLEKLDNASVDSGEDTGEKTAVIVPEVEEKTPELVNEEKDANTDGLNEPAASAYNTGKSGKIYTKEELELLIKE